MQKRMISLLLKYLDNFKLILFLGLFLIGPNLYADNAEVSNQNTNQVQNQNQIEEEHDTKNLDKLLINYNKDQQNNLKAADDASRSDGASDLSESELDNNQESQNLKNKAQDKLDPKKLKKLNYAESLRITLAPFQKLSEEQLLLTLKENTKNSRASFFVDNFPLLAIFAVRVIQNKDALPFLGKILDDKERLVHFTTFMLSSLILAFILKRLLKKEGRSIPQAVGVWFFKFSLMTAYRIIVLIYFFGPELTPVYNVAFKTLF